MARNTLKSKNLAKPKNRIVEAYRSGKRTEAVGMAQKRMEDNNRAKLGRITPFFGRGTVRAAARRARTQNKGR